MYNNNNNQLGRGGAGRRSLLHYGPPAEDLAAAVVPARRAHPRIAGTSSEKRLRVIMTLIRRNRCRLAAVGSERVRAAGRVSRAYADKS